MQRRTKEWLMKNLFQTIVACSNFCSKRMSHLIEQRQSLWHFMLYFPWNDFGIFKGGLSNGKGLNLELIINYIKKISFWDEFQILQLFFEIQFQCISEKTSDSRKLINFRVLHKCNRNLIQSKLIFSSYLSLNFTVSSLIETMV